MIADFKESNDFEGFKLEAIVNFGLDTTINAEEFSSENEQTLADKLYNEAFSNFQAHRAELMKHALPVFQSLRRMQGPHIENIVVPFTDGRRAIQVLAHLDKTIESNGLELVQSLERTVTLGFIDDSWKEHLRAMDDLKQSVQTAYYEQKDPLVIYKQEAFTLFRQMDSTVNKNIVNFLCHAEIPVEQQQPQAPIQVQVQKAPIEQKTDMSKLRSNKAQVETAGQDYAANENDYFEPTAAPVKQEPIKVGAKIGRNDPCPCGSGKKYKQCHGKDA